MRARQWETLQSLRSSRQLANSVLLRPAPLARYSAASARAMDSWVVSSARCEETPAEKVTCRSARSARSCQLLTVAQRIVDAFEVVNVNQCKTREHRVARCLALFLRQQLQRVAAVGQARQLIARGQQADLF